jgi:glycosyltransferase involved in cell wall biosynthesis
VKIDVIVPVRNGAALLVDCLTTVDRQTHRPSRIFVVVGPSDDGTESLAMGLAAGREDMVVLENPAGDRGSALNVALSSLDAATDAIALVDAQARLADDYLERSAVVLEESGAAVVGGPLRPVGVGVVGRAIAAALTSPFGVGNSSFHFVGVARDVEAAAWGVYRRSVLDRVGRYSTRLLRTEDDDMNARIRAAGGRIRLDPSINARYLARTNLRDLFRQYHGYGYWKVALAITRPGAIRPRHLVPAGFVVLVGIAGLISLLVWRPALPLFTATYAAAGLVAAFRVRDLPLRSRLVFPAAAATMHVGYGVGSWHALANLRDIRARVEGAPAEGSHP